MGTNLHQVLGSLCLNTHWNYAIFWKLKHRARMYDTTTTIVVVVIPCFCALCVCCVFSLVWCVLDVGNLEYAKLGEVVVLHV